MYIPRPGSLKAHYDGLKTKKGEKHEDQLKYI